MRYLGSLSGMQMTSTKTQANTIAEVKRWARSIDNKYPLTLIILDTIEKRVKIFTIEHKRIVKTW